MDELAWSWDFQNTPRWVTLMPYMHERMNVFLQRSAESNSLTCPCVHCLWLTLVAAFHSRNADAVLRAGQQVCGTKAKRQLVSYWTQSTTRKMPHRLFHILLLMQSACQLDGVFHNSPISSTPVMRSWQIYMNISVISEDFFFSPHFLFIYPLPAA